MQATCIENKKLRPKLAPGEDRTRGLSLTKRTQYHYATEAFLFIDFIILLFIWCIVINKLKINYQADENASILDLITLHCHMSGP